MAVRLIERLVYYGKVIHCNIIGNSRSNGMREQLEIIKSWTENNLNSLYNSNIMKLLNLLISKDFGLRYLVLGLVVFGIIFRAYSLYLLLSSGVLLGLYYGFYNDIIWRQKGKLSNSFFYRTHQLWIHIICGVIASLSLFFLLGSIDFSNQDVTLANLGLKEFILFLIVLIGYVGLLPRIIWFFSYAQSIFSKGNSQYV